MAGKKFVNSTAGASSGKPFRFNFAEIPDQDIISEEVDVNIVVKSAKPAVSKDNGNDQIKLVLEVTDGDHAKKTLFDQLTFTENTMKINKRKLVGLGLDPTSDYDSLEEMCEDLKGNEAVAHVTYDESADFKNKVVRYTQDSF